ncbi:trafficking protein Mon1-domain-containing protein [Jimgerdemannia flammicorona]|uniref:Vacuolar fusion protein MON1 n=1 Tax=Jimgerdemannia flammicorona TaxID=994334 RepID=A0A433D3D1_9FUNG|nr:trafficking protein Mon1-domain-containing protein [Jimgerdemannia flammicorona]
MSKPLRSTSLDLHAPNLILATDQPVATTSTSSAKDYSTVGTSTTSRPYFKSQPSIHLSLDHEAPAVYQVSSAASSVKSFILKTTVIPSGPNTPNEHSAAATAAAQGLSSEFGSGAEGYLSNADDAGLLNGATVQERSISAHINDALNGSLITERRRSRNYRLESPTPSVLSGRRESMPDAKNYVRLLAEMDDGMTTGSDIGSTDAIEPFANAPVDESSIQIAMSDNILHHHPTFQLSSSLYSPGARHRPVDSDSDVSSNTSSPQLNPIPRPIRTSLSMSRITPDTLSPSGAADMGAELGSSVSSSGSTESEGEKMRKIAKLKRQGSRSSVAAKKGREHRRKHGEEDQSTANWTSHKKHFFVLSSAGKPVWTRYGDESRISSLMGVIQAIVSFFADNDDSIRSINAGTHKIVFLLKDPLYFVAVARTGESENQVGFAPRSASIPLQPDPERPDGVPADQDLRAAYQLRLAAAAGSLSTLFNRDHGFMLGSIQCQRVPRELRDRIGETLAQGRAKDLLYAMIVANGKLVTLLRPRKHSLHPSDLHLLFNMLTGSTTFRSAESWTPLCLPKFNSKGFLHAYICYIERDVCLLMISTDKDRFFDLSEWKSRIVEVSRSWVSGSEWEYWMGIGVRGNLEDLFRFVFLVWRPHYRGPSEPANIRRAGGVATCADIGIPSLRHFLYKSKLNVQFTCPDLVEPYTTADERRRLFRLYQHTHDRMHSRTRPLKLYYYNSESESMLGWITSSFELYVTFNPLISKSSIIASSNHLLRWIKKHEDSLFVLNAPVF